MAGLALPRRHMDLAACATADEQKKLLFDIFKDALSGMELFGSDMLVATYVRSKILKKIALVGGGTFNLQGTDNTSQEDIFQGKAGLVLAMGPNAFKWDRFNAKWEGPSAKVGDWVMFRFAEAGMDVDVCGVYCRFVDSAHVRGVVNDPALVY